MNPARALPFLALLTLTSACDAEGTLVLRAYGEPYVEEGLTTDDGFQVSFDRFEITLEDVRIAGETVTVDAPVDLAVPSGGAGHEVGRVAVGTGVHEDVAFTLSRLLVEGSASDGADVKRFALDFEPAVRFSNCETSTRVDRGAESTFEITLHADHLFYDSRAAESPAVRFRALADADEDEDGTITRAELQSAGLGAYDPGSDGGGIESLWDFLVALVSEIAHADGEAHCLSAPAAE